MLTNSVEVKKIYMYLCIYGDYSKLLKFTINPVVLNRLSFIFYHLLLVWATYYSFWVISEKNLMSTQVIRVKPGLRQFMLYNISAKRIIKKRKLLQSKLYLYNFKFIPYLIYCKLLNYSIYKLSVFYF